MDLDRTTGRYERVVSSSVTRMPATVTVYLVLAGVIAWLVMSLPTGFVPDEDKGAFFVDFIQLASECGRVATNKVRSGRRLQGWEARWGGGVRPKLPENS